MRSIEELRNDTPGVEIVAHFNNCGSALPPNPVIDAQIEHLRLESDLGGYEAAQRNHGKRTLYSAAAALLGCGSDEIAFADSASRAWDVLVNSLGLRPGDEIVTSRLEFGVNLLILRRLAIRTGARVKIVNSRPDGTIDLDDLYRSLSDRTKLVAIAHAAGHYGGVNPVEAIGAAIAGTEAVFLVDATQSLGQLPVDVDAMRCHALTASGRKWLRGPRGTGFLYVRNDVSDRIDPVTVGLVTSDVSFDNYSIREEVALRSNARRFEAWERNVAAEIGLAVAIEYFLEVGIDWAHHRITALASYILDRLRSVPGVFVLPTDELRSGVVGLTVPGGEPAVVALRSYLRERSVHVSSMAYIDAPLDYAARGIDAVLRISPHYYNTDNEVDTLCEHLADGLKALAA
jgi:cysteine desulfurase/selenocysteine lyase